MCASWGCTKPVGDDPRTSDAGYRCVFERQKMSQSAKVGGSHVYVITSANGCKIGASRDPKSRLVGLRMVHGPDLSLEFVSERRIDAFVVERIAHLILAGFALGGEWFSVQPSTAVDAILEAAKKADLQWTTSKNKRYGSIIAGRNLCTFEGKIATAIPDAGDVREWIRSGRHPNGYGDLVWKLNALPRKDWPVRWRR